MAIWKGPPGKQSVQQPTAPQPNRGQNKMAATPKSAANKPSVKADLRLLDDKAHGATAQPTGFDPYNSGAFDFRHTWEKVTRK